MHLVNLTVTLTPVWHTDCPEIVVCSGEQKHLVNLEKTQAFDFEYYAQDWSFISVDFLNKTELDTDLSRGLDKAVIIEKVSFFGISDPKFVWAGVYTPIYPAHLTDQPSMLSNTTYLGFNGKWQLDFDVPVFTWMHKLLNFGWIYS